MTFHEMVNQMIEAGRNGEYFKLERFSETYNEWLIPEDEKETLRNLHDYIVETMNDC